MLNKHRGNSCCSSFVGKDFVMLPIAKPRSNKNLKFELTSQKIPLFEFSEILVQSKKRVLKVFCFQKCRTLWEITHPGYSALLNQVIDQFPIGHCVSIGGENVSWGICQSMKQETQDGFTPAVVKELWEWTESSLQAWPVVLKDGGDAWTNSKIAVMCWAGCSERLLWALRD